MKKVSMTFLTLSLLIGISSCKEKEVQNKIDDTSKEMDKLEDMAMDKKTVTVAMGSKSGSSVSGTIELVQDATTVSMVLTLTGLTPGDHAIHVHEKGDCSSDDGKSAGGHWNPKAEDHGKWGHDMHHAGDIGNLVADASGKAVLEFSTDQWCLDCDDETKNLIGKSFIVHADADDFQTQPTGNAGGRVACGVIE